MPAIFRTTKSFLFTPVLSIALALSVTSQAQEVLRDTLPNGLQVIIVRNTLAPVVTTMMNYRAGSDETPAGFPGSAHAMEHMMFRGSPGLSAEQLAAASAAMGGNDNADTQFAVTQYFFTTPSENLDVALRIEAQPCLVHERGGLERVSVAFAPKRQVRLPSQFVVDERGDGGAGL